MTPSMVGIMEEDWKWWLVHFCSVPFKTTILQHSLLIDPNTQRLNLHRIPGLHSIRNCKLCTWHDFNGSTQALGSYVLKNHVNIFDTNRFQVMKGHSSAVTHIIVNSDKGEIISAAQDKVIIIHIYH